MPDNFACCGIPALTSGDADSFKKMLAHNLTAIGDEKFDYVVTACASCTETIAELWEKYAEGADLEKAKSIGAKTVDISKFLVDILGVKAAIELSRNKIKVTYHDSCHLSKSLGLRS